MGDYTQHAQIVLCSHRIHSETKQCDILAPEYDDPRGVTIDAIMFGGRRKEEVEPDQVDAIQYRDTDKRVRFLNVRVTGTPDKYEVSLGRDKRGKR